MRDFFVKLMSDDETRQNYTKFELVVYGMLLPLGLVVIMAVAGWLEHRCL